MSSGTAVDVFVLLDQNDDVNDVRALHHLAARHPTVLVVTLAPDHRTAPAIVWSILRALGKRTASLQGATPEWSDAERWLAAHGIRELIVLRAQHLTDTRYRDLLETAARAAVDELVLITNDDDRRAWREGEHRTLTTTATLLERARRPDHSPSSRTSARWPVVPRSHPLRLRFDCLHTLRPADFQRVDALLNATLRSTETWLRAHPQPHPDELQDLLSVVLQADNPEQAHIRRCATALALCRAGLAMPNAEPRAIPELQLDVSQSREVHAYTEPRAGGRHLAELLTGLQPELLKLVGGDQLTDRSILGHKVPASTSPVLRAITKATGPIFPRATPSRAVTPPAGSQVQASRDPVAAMLAQLLEGRARYISRAELTAATRRQLDELVGLRILNAHRGTYRASHVALFSSFQTASPPPASTDNSMRQTAAAT